MASWPLLDQLSVGVIAVVDIQYVLTDEHPVIDYLIIPISYYS